MPTTLEALHQFLDDQGWTAVPDADGRLRWPYRGENGEWGMAAVADEPGETVTVYSLFLGEIPAHRAAASAEFCTRANFGLPWACFELGGEPLQLRCRAGVDAAATSVDAALVRNLVMHSVSAFDRYLPALRAVLEGGDPGAAVERVEVAAG